MLNKADKRYSRRVRRIFSKLSRINEFGTWDIIWWDMLSQEEREMSKSLISGSKLDFIVLEDGNALFFQDRGDAGWEVHNLNRPVYEIDISNFSDDINFEQFLSSLQHDLQGVEIEIKSDSSPIKKQNSRFFSVFYDKLTEAFYRAVEKAKRKPKNQR